jgi:hypothetical protein
MNKQMWTVMSLLILGLAGTSPALSPLGPPTAGLKQSQFGVAFEYAYGDSDLEVEGESLDDVESNAFLAQLGYGLTDDWEIYFSLGVADAEFEESGIRFDGGYEFAYGFGTKFTFIKEEPLSWGVLYEMGWRSSEDEVFGIDVDFDYYDITIAVGPTWQMAEGVRIYGGPFLYFLDGDIDVGGIVSGDVEEDSSVGGYIGAELYLNPSTCWYGEFQFTGDITVFGTGISWKF